MATKKRQRDYKAEYQRRVANAKKRGFKSYAELRKNNRIKKKIQELEYKESYEIAEYLEQLGFTDYESLEDMIGRGNKDMYFSALWKKYREWYETHRQETR